MLKKARKVLFVLGMMIFFTSCGNKHVILTYEPGAYTEKVEFQPKFKVCLGKMTDRRQMNNVICEAFLKSKKSSAWIADNSVTEFLTRALQIELKNIGIQVAMSTKAINENIPRIEGQVNVFYGWSTYSSSNFSAAINVDFLVVLNSYIVFHQSYFSKKSGPKKSKECVLLLKMASKDVMKKFAFDIREFLLKEVDNEKK